MGAQARGEDDQGDAGGLHDGGHLAQHDRADGGGAGAQEGEQEREAGAGVFWAAYIVLGHRVAADRGLRAQDGLALAMAIGAVGLAPALVVSAVPALIDPLLLAACLAVGVASSVVPYGLEQVAMRRLPRARFALLLALLPATAAVIGAIVLGQVPGLLEATGIALVVVAASLRTHADPPVGARDRTTSGLPAS